MGIHIIETKIEHQLLKQLLDSYFKDMIKYVVDTKKGKIGIGGELHADAEQMLLDEGSLQSDLWGANYYPGKGEEGCIEYTALINIRPSRGNSSMEILDQEAKDRVKEITFSLIGKGEPI